MGNSLIIKERNKNNNEEITLIWLDCKMNAVDHVDDTKKRLYYINDYVVFFTELESCIKYMESIHNEKILLISSISDITQILTQIENLSQIDSIFIFNWEQKFDDCPILKHSKIIGIFNDFDMLSVSIEKQIEFLNEHFQTFSFFDQNEHFIKDLSKHTADLLWYQLYHDVLCQSTYITEDALQTMIHEYRSSYRENSKAIETIENFAREYRPDDALQWYLKKHFSIE
ncbi:unnamed protein product [Rotaria sp. Silwood2]|nr:unnamed protein product [Rotaria sp. Silwood2]